MNGRVIPLRFDVLESPTRIDIALVEAWMLWPNDEIKRDRAFKASVVHYAKSHEAEIQTEEWKTLFFLLADADRLSDLRQEVKEGRILRGMIAGNFLRLVLQALWTGGAVSMTDCKAKATARYVKDRTLPKKAFDDEIWPAFRGVSHFWAASLDAWNYGGQRVFPCEVEVLGKFLVAAETYRRAGEELHTPKSPNHVLRASDSIGLPPELGILPTNFAF